MAEATPWDKTILDKMEPGAVTFAWDDGEIRTISVPEGILNDMQAAWLWIDPMLRALEAERGKPRSVCFHLGNGQFRGLRFPDVNPGPLE